MKNKLGFWSIVLLGINGIIGSGIFLLPGQGMTLFGPASILVLVFDAVLAFTIALCFAECASFFDKTGGAYLYAKDAFGDFVGYEVGMISWAIRIIAEATIYVAFATAIGGIFPALASTFAKNVIVTVIAVLLIIMNVCGVKVTSIVNNTITVGKLLPIIFIIVVGLFFIKPANFQPFFIPSLMTSHNFAATAITMFYIFTGFESLVVAAGEMKNAEKNLPRALVLILTVVAVIYILVNVVSIGVLGMRLMGSAVPLKDTAVKISGNVGNVIISAGMLLSTGGICIGSSFITPRSCVALAENGMMPRIFAKTNKHDAPYMAIIVSTTIALLLAYSGNFSSLAQISAVSRFAQYIPTCIAVLIFRRTKKRQAGKFRIPFGPLVPILALVVSVWLLCQISISNLIWGLGAFVIAAPFYPLTRRKKKNA
ncbi:APC family permease [Lactobacillus sp. ESL0791]|uniref:APC family permease n=1 Tax=Lactobacillus sp. ESL0791 TaxID=2983234 RepID=UPI0023F9F8C8|nr:APC family permease [Lactobacillus sp. ESL0791]MDF7639292.1 APC family permease [Lactobacillus sp. ESL0791]